MNQKGFKVWEISSFRLCFYWDFLSLFVSFEWRAFTIAPLIFSIFSVTNLLIPMEACRLLGGTCRYVKWWSIQSPPPRDSYADKLGPSGTSRSVDLGVVPAHQSPFCAGPLLSLVRSVWKSFGRTELSQPPLEAPSGSLIGFLMEHPHSYLFFFFRLVVL